MRDKSVGQIYETDDYSKFKRLEGNRNVKSVKKILDSLDSVGYVLSPILVNEKFEVIDGQHRLEAFKKRGLPIHYMMQEGIGLKECQNLNTGQSNWTTMNYISSYAESGDEAFLRLASLVTEFGKTFRLEGVLMFAIGYKGQGGQTHKMIKEKAIDLTEERYELARERLHSSMELGFADLQKQNKFYVRSWWGAVSYAYQHQDVNVKELALRLKNAPLELKSYNRTEDQLAVFDKIYNKGRRNKVFMSSDFQLGKYKE